MGNQLEILATPHAFSELAKSPRFLLDAPNRGRLFAADDLRYSAQPTLDSLYIRVTLSSLGYTTCRTIPSEPS